ncbi:MAG: nitroreductase family protein [Verrucomicrobia bacterium]|nr:nitroreductase family protein [Verrucomicrobiota bacterium]
MSLFVVDEEKCGLCGVCVAACPAGLVRINASQPIPVPADGADEACFDCGHCVAACPNEAFSHKNATPEQCLPIREDLRIGRAQVGQLMRSRRSIRNYETRPVARETISDLLDIARFAPSGCNSQPVHWLVIHDTEQVRQISAMVVDGLRNMLKQDSGLAIRDVLARLVKAWDDGADIVSRGAPHLIIAHGPQANPMAPAACIIAQTYLELAASVFGLGTCWVGLVDMTANTWPPLRQFLGLPEGHVVLGTMAVGHPKFQYARIPPRNAVRVTWRQAKA